MLGMTKTENRVMITKQQIDDYFNSNYKFLLLSIKKTKIKYQQVTEWDSEELLSATYIHLVDNQHKMKGEKCIESFFMRYMSNQIMWNNSAINQLYNDKKMIAHDEMNFDIVEDESELQFKLGLEKDYARKKAILYDFYMQLDTKQEKILFEVIFHKGIKTVKALSAHFGINRNYIQNMKKKLMDDLKEYIKNIDEKQYK